LFPPGVPASGEMRDESGQTLAEVSVCTVARTAMRGPRGREHDDCPRRLFGLLRPSSMTCCPWRNVFADRGKYAFAGGPRSAPCWRNWSRRSSGARVGRWFCGARRGSGRRRCWKYLVGSASHLTVVRAVGVESEMELAYASLHQLCGPMLDRLGKLPAPQRLALEVVFGVSVGAAPDRFLVGLGVLSLFSEVSAERPLSCVIDDAQWVDRASALTLAFVARRLLAERVGLVFAAREPGQELRQVAEMRVQGLRDGDARALLSSAVRFRLDERVRDRIIEETRGNPLALVELPKGLRRQS
jgi:hypothetical protein